MVCSSSSSPARLIQLEGKGGKAGQQDWKLAREEEEGGALFGSAVRQQQSEWVYYEKMVLSSASSIIEFQKEVQISVYISIKNSNLYFQ